MCSFGLLRIVMSFKKWINLLSVLTVSTFVDNKVEGNEVEENCCNILLFSIKEIIVCIYSFLPLNYYSLQTLRMLFSALFTEN